MRHWIRRIMLVIVLLACAAAFISLMFSVNTYAHIPLLVGAIALVTTTLLGRGIRRDGWRYPLRLLLSVRMRLTLWYIVVLAAVISVFAFGIYYTQQTYLYADLNKQLDTRLQQIATTYDDQTGLLSVSSDIPQVKTPESKSTDFSPVGQTVIAPISEVVLLLAPNGVVKQQSNEPLDSATLHLIVQNILQMTAKYDISSAATYPAIQTRLKFDLPNGSITGDDYSITGMPILRNKQEVAVLVVGIRNDVPAQLDNLASALLSFGPLVLFIAAIGGFWLAGLSMRPVQTITRTAQQIGESDLSRRLKLRRRDELGELAATFDHMLDRLEAAFMRQRQFTADASHELRTPLTIVNLETNRLLTHPNLSLEERQSLMTIQQENSAMALLVHDLLLLARTDAGPSIIRHEQVDLSEVVLEVVERMAPLARHSRLHIMVAPLPDLTLWGDRVYLMQMLCNIVENALKYGTRGGTCVQIALEHDEKQGDAWAILRVQDDGPGIAAEHLPHLFERFYRVDNSRTHNPQNLKKQSRRVLITESNETHGQSSEHETEETQDMVVDDQPIGNGLGLAIVQWIAEAHGGSVQVHSQVGIGTAFEVLLPCC